MVAYTGSTDDEAQDRIHRAGFDGYLTKPVDLEQLSRLLSVPPKG
jgi:CheY-like chemotaxis protein